MHDHQVAGRGLTGIGRVGLSLNISGIFTIFIPWLRLQLQLGGSDDSLANFAAAYSPTEMRISSSTSRTSSIVFSGTSATRCIYFYPSQLLPATELREEAIICEKSVWLR